LLKVLREGVGIFEFCKKQLAGDDGAHLLTPVPSRSEQGKAS